MIPVAIAASTGIPLLLNFTAPVTLSAQTPAHPQGLYFQRADARSSGTGNSGSTEPKRVRPATAGPVAPPDGGIQATLKSTPRFTTATITPVEWHMGGASEVISPTGTVEYKMIGIKRLAMLAWPSMQVFGFALAEASEFLHGAERKYLMPGTIFPRRSPPIQHLSNCN